MFARTIQLFYENSIKWTISFIAVIIFQISVLRFFSLTFVPNTLIQPDIVLLLLFHYGTRHTQISSTLVGFTSGLLLDAFSGGIIGLNALTKTAAGYIVGFLPEAHKIQKLTQFCLLFFFMNFIHDILFNSIYILNSEFSLWRLIVFNSLPSCLYTVFIGGLIFYAKQR